jgi:UTP--glucose-1-phosphate uridylyltransferase
MKIRKAVITAAAPNQRKLPLQSLIDKDGERKSVLEILVNEVITTGIKEICVIVHPGDENNYCQVAGANASLIEFVGQENPHGYGHALHCAAAFTADEPFLHLVADHLYVNRSEKSCAQRLIEFAASQHCAVSTVQPTRESLIPNFGVIGGKRHESIQGVYEVKTVIEKPTPTEAEQKLMVPGLRMGHYLCFFGMHVLTPAVMHLLEDEIRENPGSNINLTPSLNRLAGREQYLALEMNDLRYDMGDKYGLLKAQMALALYGNDRDRVLTELLDFFVTKDLNSPGK